MIASDLIRFVTMAVIAVLLLSGRAQVWSLALLGFVYGCGDAFFFPAYGALIQQLVPPERLQEANSLRGMADGFGWFVGPAISGILVALVGAGGTLGLDAVTFLVSAGFLLTLRVPALLRTKRGEASSPSCATAARGALADLAVGDDVARHARPVRDHRAAAGARSAGAHRAAPEPGALGSHGGLFSLGMLGGGLIALYYRPRRPMVTVAVCGTTASVPLIALALKLAPAQLLAVWFVRGVAIGVLSAVWDTTLQQRIAGESMARVSSWDWMTAGGLWPLGLVLAGPVAQLMGVTDALWLSGGLGLALSLWVLLVKDVWRLRGLPPADATATPAP